MRPDELQVIGSELAVRWPDGTETFLPLAALRRACPCAGCKGEMDVMGNLYKAPEKALSEASFRVKHLGLAGGYAVQPVWEDRHSSGLYSWDYLRTVAKNL